MGNPPVAYWLKVEQQWGHLGDRVYCRICGRCFRFLGGHIKKHHLSESAYRDAFGILYGLPLCSDDVLVAQRVAIIKNIEAGITPNLPNKLTPSSPNKGRLEHKQSIVARRLKLIGRLVSDKTRQKLSNSLMGHLVSRNTKNKISVAKKGQRKGISLSDAHKQKISLALRGRILSAEHREKLIPILKHAGQKRWDRVREQRKDEAIR